MTLGQLNAVVTWRKYGRMTSTMFQLMARDWFRRQRPCATNAEVCS